MPTADGVADCNSLVILGQRRSFTVSDCSAPPAPSDPYAGGLPVINTSNPSAVPLQTELKRVGYLADSVVSDPNYGPLTQNAVQLLYANNTQIATPANPAQIGPLGWAELRAESTDSYTPTPSAGEPAHNYTRVSYTGRTINVRTRTMLERAVVNLRDSYEWAPYLTQGSYNPGGVGASGGTHDGGGAVDIRVTTMAENGRHLCVQALREVGFAAWYRVPAEGFSVHIHAVAIGDRQLSPQAANQVQAYFNGLNGLANNGPDSAPGWVGRPWPSWANQYNL